MISPSKMTLNELRDLAHANARAKGFYDFAPGIGAVSEWTLLAKLALIHSEVSEAVECVRNNDMGMRTRVDGKPEGFNSEIADTVIRLLDLCGYMNIDIDMCVRMKMAFNEGREYKHGKAI